MHIMLYFLLNKDVRLASVMVVMMIVSNLTERFTFFTVLSIRIII